MQSQRTTPLRNPHTSTSDLLTWSEQPPPESSASDYRSRQPSDKIGVVLRGSQLTAEEAQSLTKKKPYSGYKLKEMTGSGIFSGNSEDTTSEENSANSKNRTSIRVYKQAMNGISQISFSTEGNISPKKPTSLPEIAKQRELGGTYQSKTVTKINKQTSSAKTKELSGSDIFAPPSEILPCSLAAAHSLESKESKDTRISVPQKVSTSAQVSNRADGQSNFSFSEQPVKILRKKMHDQKFAEMTGNNIFKGDVPAGSPEKPSSRAKLREMAGSDIFADGKAESRDHILGARKPPGGGSDIFADGKAESRDHILGARRPPGGGSDIFADGKAESRDHILGARRPPGGGSDIFADGKAESRDLILGACRPPVEEAALPSFKFDHLNSSN